MSYYANTKIRTKDGTVYTAVEYPEQVMLEQAKALTEERLMRLERPTIPTGDMFWLDPSSVMSIMRES